MTDLENMTPMQMVREMMDRETQLNDAIKTLRSALHNEADCEETYRQTRKAAWARAYDEIEGKPLAKHMEDWVDAESAAARAARDHAVSESKVWYEKVRALRQGLSAMQTGTNSIKQEMGFEQTKPDWGA